jgi:hypothetical protein
MAICSLPCPLRFADHDFSGFLLIFGLSDAAEIVMFYQSVKLSATSKTKAMRIFERNAPEGPRERKTCRPLQRRTRENR